VKKSEIRTQSKREIRTGPSYTPFNPFEKGFDKGFIFYAKSFHSLPALLHPQHPSYQDYQATEF